MVPTLFPIFDAVAPVGAAGGSEAHSALQVAFICESAPMLFTDQVKPEP